MQDEAAADYGLSDLGHPNDNVEHICCRHALSPHPQDQGYDKARNLQMVSGFVGSRGERRQTI